MSEKDNDYIKDGKWLSEQEELLAIELLKHKPIEIKCSKCGGSGKVPKNTSFEDNIYIALSAIMIILGVAGTVSFAIPVLQPISNAMSFLMTMIFLILIINTTKGKY